MQVEVVTDLTVGELIELKRSKILTVNHEYQRGLRWTELQKRMFLDSIFRDYSIPAFYFHEVKEGAASIQNTFFEIVDGQQRVDAIYSYSENAFALIDPNASEFRFPNFVKDRPCGWAGRRYEELSGDLKDKLRQTKIVAYKLTTDDENEIRDLFIRLQGGTALSPQDKRDSWPGNFTEFVLRVGGKSQVDKWYGVPLFKELVKGSESKRRQLAAQAFMLFDAVRRQRTFCDIKSANIDEFYHQNVGFDERSAEAQRFERVCEALYGALAGNKAKLVGHHLIHSVLLFSSLKDEYAKGWERLFAGALHEFEKRCVEASKANKERKESEFKHYWSSYGQWAQTQTDRGATIQRRHAFFAAEMIELLSPQRLDEQRLFSEFEKEVVFFRDGQRCQKCAMIGEEHPVRWAECEVHHVLPFSEGGATVLENGALVHRDCHPKGESEVRTFRERWRLRAQRAQMGEYLDEAVREQKARQAAFPPDSTQVRFTYKDTTYTGVVTDGAVHLGGAHMGMYRTFSAASKAITGTDRNGWRDWFVRLPNEEAWMTAEEWRNAP